MARFNQRKRRDRGLGTQHAEARDRARVARAPAVSSPPPLPPSAIPRDRRAARARAAVVPVRPPRPGSGGRRVEARHQTRVPRGRQAHAPGRDARGRRGRRGGVRQSPRRVRDPLVREAQGAVRRRAARPREADDGRRSRSVVVVVVVAWARARCRGRVREVLGRVARLQRRRRRARAEARARGGAPPRARVRRGGARGGRRRRSPRRGVPAPVRDGRKRHPRRSSRTERAWSTSRTSCPGGPCSR